MEKGRIPALKEWAKLCQHKYRAEYNQYLIEGEKLVEEAIKAHVPLEAILYDRAHLCSFPSEIPTFPLPSHQLKKISTLSTPPSVIAIGTIAPPSLQLKGPLIVGIEGIQDPGNMGSILRTVLAFGVMDLIADTQTVDFYHPKVVRASGGALFYLNLHRTHDLESALQSLKKEGYLLVGTAPKGGVPPLISPPMVLLIGSEGKGISDTLSHMMDVTISIPIDPRVESLNVGVALGVILSIAQHLPQKLEGF